KRVALSIIDIFLRTNGMELVADQAEAVESIMDVAKGSVDEESLAAFAKIQRKRAPAHPAVGRASHRQFAGPQPMRTIGRQAATGDLVAARNLVRRQDILPTPVRTLVEKRVRAILEYHLDAGVFRSDLAHVVQAAMLEDRGPRGLVNVDPKKCCDAPDLAVQIGLQIVEMQQEDVRQSANLPP